MTAKPPTDLPGTRILNGENWANNSAAGILARTTGTLIIFGQSSSERDTDLWLIRSYRDGYKILNAGSNNWASASGNEVLGVPDFDGDTCKWLIEYTGKDQEFWIRCPKLGGAVWTVRSALAQVPSVVTLEPLKEQHANQRITFAVPQ